MVKARVKAGVKGAVKAAEKSSKRMVLDADSRVPGSKNGMRDSVSDGLDGADRCDTSGTSGRDLPPGWNRPLDSEDEGLWALAEMTGCALPDPRFVLSAARNAHRLALHCGESFSASCGPDGRQAATRLFHHKELTVDKLLQGHYQQTARRCAEHDVLSTMC